VSIQCALRLDCPELEIALDSEGRLPEFQNVYRQRRDWPTFSCPRMKSKLAHIDRKIGLP